MAALGTWLPHAKELPQPVVKHLEAGLKEKEALKRAHLRCLAAVGARPTWLTLTWHQADWHGRHFALVRNAHIAL